MAEEELHPWVVHRLIGTVDDALQHKIGFLQLVPEEEIGVRELHFLLALMCLREVAAQYIQAAEHPATSRTFLVMNVLRGCQHREMVVKANLSPVVLGQVVNRVRRNGISQGLFGHGRGLRLLNLLQHFDRNTTLGLGRKRHGHGHEKT